jgi:hypothetical protein
MDEIWDIARNRVSQSLCDIGIETDRASRLAKFLVDLAYKDLIGGEHFTGSGGKRQKFLFAEFVRGAEPVGPRIISINPDDPQADLAELELQKSSPQNIVVSIHRLVIEALDGLENRPGEVDGWIRESRKKMFELVGEVA